MLDVILEVDLKWGCSSIMCLQKCSFNLLDIILSNIFYETLIIAIGLSLPISLRLPVLNTGVIKFCFHCLGYISVFGNEFSMYNSGLISDCMQFLIKIG